MVADGQYFPIECTAITPKAVGAEGRVPFEKAVQIAAEDLQQQQLKILYSVRQYQQNGYASPELPDVDGEKIKNLLASRRPMPAPATGSVQVAAPAPADADRKSVV